MLNRLINVLDMYMPSKFDIAVYSLLKFGGTVLIFVLLAGVIIRAIDSGKKNKNNKKDKK